MGRKVYREENLISAENFNCREKMLPEENLVLIFMISIGGEN